MEAATTIIMMMVPTTTVGIKKRRGGSFSASSCAPGTCACTLLIATRALDASRSPVQPQLDYDWFNPYDPASVSAQAQAVCKCLNDVHKTTQRASAALPPIEALQLAIRQCTRQLLVHYLED